MQTHKAPLIISSTIKVTIKQITPQQIIQLIIAQTATTTIYLQTAPTTMLGVQIINSLMFNNNIP
jgi:hypothetical protein